MKNINHKMNLKKITLGFSAFLLFLFLTVFVLEKFIMDKIIFRAKVNSEEIALNLNENYELTKSQSTYLKNKGYDFDIDKKYLKQIYWSERIKDGGLILLFRHSERQKWNNSVEGFDTYELAKNHDARNQSYFNATCLTDKGIEETKLIKQAFKKANIKISKIISSPSYRARETAIYAFDRIDEYVNALLHYTAFHPSDRKNLGIRLREYVLSQNIQKGSNIVLSAHNKVISHHGFIDSMEVPEDLKESGFYIIEKEGDKLITRFKFSKIKEFVVLQYRQNFRV